MIEAPQSFVVKQECDKAAWSNGFRKAVGETDGWSAYKSTTAQGTLYLAAGGQNGPWYIATDHPGISAEIGFPLASTSGPGLARYSFEKLSEAYVALDRIYHLAKSLPDAPLLLFQSKIKGMPQTTDAERLIVQRIGQGIFRNSLVEYWQGRCPLTGIEEPELLRASHIIPWAQCGDSERLNVYNGLLLSALWDAAFDKGLVTFDENGDSLFSTELGDAARIHLHVKSASLAGQLTSAHMAHMQWHRMHIFRGANI